MDLFIALYWDILVKVLNWVLLLDVGDDDPITAVFVSCVYALHCSHLGLRVLVGQKPSPLAVGDKAAVNGLPETYFAADVYCGHLALVKSYLKATSIPIEGTFLNLTLHHVCQVIIARGLVLPKVYYSSYTSKCGFNFGSIQVVICRVSILVKRP